MNNTCPTRDLERKEVPRHRDASGASLASPIDRGAGKCPCCGSDNTEWIWSGEALEVSEAHGWKITRQRLHAVATSGYITHEVVGGRLRFDKQSVIAWAENPDLRRSGRKNHRDEQND